MSISKSLSLIFISTIFFWLIWLVFFFFVEPTEGGIFALIIFFLSLFLGLLGIFTLLFIILKFRHLKNKEKIFEKFSSSFRQAIFISIFLISLLILRTLRFLEWWSAASLLLFFLLLELIFLTKKKKFYSK